MNVIDGACVIVTGGSSGIGLATAKAFARRGAHVGIVARDLTRLEAAKEAIRHVAKTSDQRFASASADLSQWHEAKAAVERLVAEGFEPDVLVNCAGVIIPGEFTQLTPEEFDRNMLHGFDSVVNPCRAVAPGMVQRGRGHIVNVSSGAGYLGFYGYTGYSSAKFAVMGFTEALRFEMKPQDVRVSVVCPPDTDTPGLAYEKTLRPPETEKSAGKVKPIPPESVAEAIIKGVEKNRYYIIPGFTSRLAFRLKGLWPELWLWIVDNDVRKSRRERGLE
jgi:3-dehydrosphinganine reductase